MISNKFMKFSTISLVASAFIVGCGSSSDNPLKSIENEVKRISGKAVDGYLRYSTVCLDINADSFCQPSEPFTITDINGSYDLTVTKAHQALEGFNNAQLVIYGGQDSDMPGIPFKGKLKAPNDGTGLINITPISTLVSARIEESKSNNQETTILANIKAAKQKIADIFDISLEDVDKDPKEIKDNKVNAKLLNINLQIQKAVTKMAEATRKDINVVETNSGDIEKDIFLAIASGLDGVTGGDIANTMSDIIDNTPNDRLNKNATKVKELAKVTAKNIHNDFSLADEEMTIEELNKKIRNMIILDEKIEKEIEKANFSDDSFEFNSTILDNLEVTQEEFQNEFDDAYFKREEIKIIFDNNGLEFNDDLNISDLNISFDMEFDELKQAFEDSSLDSSIKDEITQIVEQKKKDIEDIQQEHDDRTNQLVFEDSIDTIFKTKNIATTQDARNMFSNIRETANTFINNNIDGADTIVGSQATLITDKIKPAVEDIAKDFTHSSKVLKDSFINFTNSLDTNFQDVFMSIGDEFKNLNRILESEEVTENWSVDSKYGVISHTYSKDINSSLVEETLSIDNVKLYSQYEDKEDGRLKVFKLDDNKSFELKGDNYHLEVSLLSFRDNTIDFVAKASIDGLNDSKMRLEELSVFVDLDNVESRKLLDLEAKLQGKITSNNTEIQGLVEISNNRSIISVNGSYKDFGTVSVSSNLSLNGSIRAKLNVDNIQNIDSSSSYIDPKALSMAIFADGSKSFVSSYTTEYENTKEGYKHTFNMMTQNGIKIECQGESNNTNSEYKYTFVCDDNVTIQPFYPKYNNQVVVAIIDNKEHIIEEAYIGHNGPRIDFKGDNKAHTYLDNDKLMLDGKEIIIQDLKIKDAIEFNDFDFDMEFNGEINHAQQKIKATIGLKQQVNDKLSFVYAKNIVVTNGSSSASISNLSLRFGNDRNNTNEINSYNYSDFESYTQSNTVTSNESEEDILENLHSINIDNAQLSIVDTSDKVLYFNTDLSIYKTTHNDVQVKFNGEYKYDGVSFKGIVESDFNIESKRNNIYVSGEVIPNNNFQPFSIVAKGEIKEDNKDVKALFTRTKRGVVSNTLYQIAVKLNNDDLKFADSNGILSSYNQETKVLTVLNNQETKLATVGKKENGNDWEIKYFNTTNVNSTETLF